VTHKLQPLSIPKPDPIPNFNANHDPGFNPPNYPLRANSHQEPFLSTINRSSSAPLTHPGGGSRHICHP